MTEAHILEEVEDLKASYSRISTAKGSAGQILIRLDQVTLPDGCTPATISAIVVCDSEARPKIYVKPGIILPNGIVPRSTSPVQVEGEEWMQFSYTFPYDENVHSLVQFVAAALRRFAKLE